MANEIEIVKHVKKTRANLPATLDSSTIYFVTDEKKIQLGNDDYTGIRNGDDIKSALGCVYDSTASGKFLQKDGTWMRATDTRIQVNNGAWQEGDVSLTIPTKASDISAVPTTRKVNGHALSSDVTVTASDVGAVPTTRKVNNKALSSDISLNAGDVGALATSVKDTTAPNANSTNDTIPTSAAVWSSINNAIGDMTGAMKFKGTIAGGSTGDYGALTPAANAGDTYKVSNTGKIDGIKVEAGDTMYCILDTVAATTSNWGTIASRWNVVQKNEDGLVTGPSESTADHVVTFADATGKVIKDSGKVLEKSVTSSSQLTDQQCTGPQYHYTPTATEHDELNAGSGKAVQKIQRDEKGHVTSITAVDIISSHQTVKQDGITGSTINRYGVCSTAAATAAKAVSITSGTMPSVLDSSAAGLKITVKFSNANTATSPTLNVNSKGAKNIYHKGSQITSGSNKALLSGVCDFVFDGTQWHLVGSYIDTTSDLSVDSTNSRIKTSGSTTEYAQFSSPQAGVLKITDAHGATFNVNVAQTALPVTTESDGRDGLMSKEDMTKFALMWDALLWG